MSCEESDKNSKTQYQLLDIKKKPEKVFDQTPFSQWNQFFFSIAGHCTIDPNNAEYFYQTAYELEKIGVTVLRGGVWKPRTSPYSFRGSDVSLSILMEAKKKTGLPVLTEVMDSRHLAEVISAGVDVIQVGTRNALNHALLEKIGNSLASHPECSVVLKHGLHMGTPQEFLCAAEYIRLQGTKNIILCLRGIAPGIGGFRYQIDSANALLLKELTWAPIIFDPSHSTGRSHWVSKAAMASAAYGCDGINIECHSNPRIGLCDDPTQSITPRELERLLGYCKKIKEFSNQHGRMSEGSECGAVG